MADSTWTFEDHESGRLELDVRRLRLEVIRLAHQLHETGDAVDGDDIRATARKVLAFVNGEEASLTV